MVNLEIAKLEVQGETVMALLELHQCLLLRPKAKLAKKIREKQQILQSFNCSKKIRKENQNRDETNPQNEGTTKFNR